MNDKATRDFRVKHGMSKTSTYRAWVSMKQRCNDQSYPAYHNYGGRGIKVCPEWQVFEQFYADMGKRPKGYELDRVNNDGDYCPENCRWVTSEQNNNNRRNNVVIEYEGQSLTIAQWARKLGAKYAALYTRYRNGWSAEEMITRPFNDGKRRR